jgi:hypothetical protein
VPKHRHPKRWLETATIAVAILIGYVYLPAIGALSGGTLAHTVAQEVGSTPFRACTQGKESWTCLVNDFESSGAVEYAVTVHGRCWTARSVGDRGSFSESASGCAKFNDQVRLLSRLLDPDLGGGSD